MTEWKTYKLGDIAKFQTGKLNSNAAVENGKYPFFTCSPNTLAIDNYAFDKEAILLAGNNAEGNFSIKYYKGKFNAYQRTYIIETYNDICDIKFLFYALKLCLQQFKLMSQGTSTKFLTAVILNNFEISLPGLEVQRRIAGILGAIDDKIENNRRINTNLELQAQTLYKQWFVDNRKDDWEEKQLGEIALHITDGVHNTVIDSPNGEYYLLSCKNIKSGQLLIGSNERRIDHEIFAKLRKRTRLSQGDILVTSVGTVGEMYLVNESPTNYEFQRSVAIIKPNQDIISSYFLYAALLYQRNEIKHLAHGAVQQCIFISDLKEYSLIVPNKDDISTFDEVVAPMFNKIGELQKENETLSTLRDTLLPKLMNGEIKIAE